MTQRSTPQCTTTQHNAPQCTTTQHHATQHHARATYPEDDHGLVGDLLRGR
eukprot:CAMPEP_0182609746 /NCGR_PEP_ID=MMETSP1330-20130603/4045_1 /TAXON_ID=464278 /ORGANISM="Picochlorum sp., Strain RCC944" /LENGTH=50 /DNA_ID=CAMNT_0024828643 /DNA_START=138 /DNA_END=287 /DNA_ORIENTATION=+